MKDDTHWLQKQVQTRLDLVLFVIGEKADEGIEGEAIIDMMFVSYGVHPRTTKEYLFRLSSAGKIRKEGSKYYIADKRGAS
jgi:hypothetical protein